MAIYRTCDYCGERCDRHLTVEAGRFELVGARSVTYGYCEDCYEEVLDVLDSMLRWAHRRKGSGLVWTLKEQPPARERVAAEREVKRAEVRERASTPIKGKLRLHGVDGLSAKTKAVFGAAGVRTLEEAAERSALDLLMFPGLGRVSVEKLAVAMEAHELSFLPSPTPEQLGKRLRDEREARGIGRGELADIANPWQDSNGRQHGIWGSTIGQFERGDKVPTRRQLDALCEALSLPVEQVLSVA